MKTSLFDLKKQKIYLYKGIVFNPKLSLIKHVTNEKKFKFIENKWEINPLRKSKLEIWKKLQKQKVY
jgi:ribosome-associated toxin RatA of RatAB toxin-antitoxin module